MRDVHLGSSLKFARVLNDRRANLTAPLFPIRLPCVPKRIFLTVAEVSGDRYAAKLVAALHGMDPTITFEAFGGPALAAAGAKLHAETVRGAAMTFHALTRVREMRRLLEELRQRYAEDPPDLHVCVDSSGVNLHFAKVAKHFGVPVFYFVAPQLWASRPWRIRDVRKNIARVASIFPFEAEWYRARGVDADFVGHPLFDDLPADRLAQSAAPPRFPDRPPVIGLMPGSRKSEVRENFPRLLRVAAGIRAKYPSATFLIPTTASVDRLVREMIFPAPPPAAGKEGVGAGLIVALDAFDVFVPKCDLCLTKSGTSTVHIAAYGVPMIVVYAANRFLWHGIARWLLTTKKIAMVNIMAGQIDLVPEFVPWHGSIRPVLDTALDLLNRPDKRAAQREALIHVTAPLSTGDAARNAAGIAMEMIADRK